MRLIVPMGAVALALATLVPATGASAQFHDGWQGGGYGRDFREADGRGFDRDGFDRGGRGWRDDWRRDGHWDDDWRRDRGWRGGWDGGWRRDRGWHRGWDRGRGWRGYGRCWTEWRWGGPVRVCR
ncbi:hypothetical protein [Sphingomonas sp.]|uniref:hypothetical protein n=1 Tax=Sphingomonas sp. TaxID=28214 RepID=UPI001DE3D812|nr:hypothetical protein [Sphingomonas sp.]MBX9797636.1 hypothetical protein [Sphingomonas sp.]